MFSWGGGSKVVEDLGHGGILGAVIPNFSRPLGIIQYFDSEGSMILCASFVCHSSFQSSHSNKEGKSFEESWCLRRGRDGVQQG